jgi:hypothetical protein
MAWSNDIRYWHAVHPAGMAHASATVEEKMINIH